MTDASIRAIFARYESVFNEALHGGKNMDDVSALYASEFIAASPAGVMAGKSGEPLKQAMAQGYERYRAIGTKSMRVRDVCVTPLDGLHCVAHVAWTVTYSRRDEPALDVDFEVHCFVQEMGRDLKVFGWVAGDEEAVLRRSGLL